MGGLRQATGGGERGEGALCAQCQCLIGIFGKANAQCMSSNST